jgi:hypothetical protein
VKTFAIGAAYPVLSLTSTGMAALREELRREQVRVHGGHAELGE